MTPGPSRDDLVTWLARWTSRRPAIVMVGLAYCAEIDRSQPLGTRPVPRGLADDLRQAEVSTIVAELYQQAEGWAARSCRPQQFALTAHRSEDTAVSPVDTIPFLIEPSGDFATKEEADPRDMIGHLQRMNADLHRMSGQNMQQCMDGLRDENESLRRQVMGLSDRLIKLVLEQQTLLDRKVAREVDAENQRVMIDLKRQAGSMVFALIAKKIEEGSVAPGALPAPRPTAPTPAAVVKLLLALSEDQRRLFLPLWPAVEATMSPEGRVELGRMLREAATPPGASGTNGAPAGEARAATGAAR